MALTNKFSDISSGTPGTQPTGWSEVGTVPPTLTVETASGEGIPQKNGTQVGKVVWGIGGAFVGISATLTGLIIGMKYRPGIWVYVPSVNGQDVGVLINSGPTGESTVGRARDTWLWCEVEFTATATSHDFAVWPDSPPSIANQKTYFDFPQLLVTTRWGFPGIPDGQVRPGQLAAIYDNLDKFLPLQADNKPATQFDGYLSLDTLGKLWINDTADVYHQVGKRSMVHVGRESTAQSAASATDVAISWDTERTDTNSMWAVSPNPTRLVIPFAGIFLVQWQLIWSNLVDNQSYIYFIKLNGTTDIASSSQIGSAGGWSLSGNGATIYSFAANDYLEAFFRQISGVSENSGINGETASGAGLCQMSVTALRIPA